LKKARGESHPSSAYALENLAEAHYKSGDYARAEPLFRQAIAIFANAYGRPNVNSLSALAFRYLEKGDYTHAEPLIRQSHAGIMLMYENGNYDNAVFAAERAAKLARQGLGEDHPLHAESLALLARGYMGRSDYARAEPALGQVVDIMKRAHGEAHADYARALNELTALYEAKGDYAAAEPLLRRALGIVKQSHGESHPDYARALAGLARMYKAKGEYSSAEPLLRQALEIMKRERGESDAGYVAMLNELADLYRDTGDGGRAEALYRRTLELAFKLTSMATGPTATLNPMYVRALHGLAELYRDRGDYGRAEPLLRQAVARKSTQYDLGHAACLEALASVYLDMGDDLRAEAPLAQALEDRRKAQGESHPDYARSLGALARLYAARGDFARAEPLCRQAVEIQRQARGESHSDYAAALGDLAELYLARGDSDRAEPLLRRAVEARRKVQGDSHPDYARSLGALARVYAGRGDHARAESLFRQAIEIQRRARGESHPDYAAALGDLGELYLARGDANRAGPLLREALDLESAWLRDLCSAFGERQRLRLYAGTRRFLDSFLSVATVGTAPPSDLYARVLDCKGVVDAEMAEERLARDEPDLRVRLEELALVKAKLARLAFAGWRTTDLTRRKESLEADLAARSAAFRAQRKSTPGPEQVTASLCGDEALVDLFEYTHAAPPDGNKGPLRRERRLLAFVLRPGKPAALVPLGPARPVTEAVLSWHGALALGWADGVQAAAAALARHVWDPIRPHLEGARTVLIAADGALLSFPFAALPGTRRDSYLIEDLAVAYVASGRKFVQMRAVRLGPPGRGLLAVGGVDFQADPGRSQHSDRPEPAAPAPAPLLAKRGGFASLPGTLPEAESVRAQYRGAFADQPADLLVGADAREGELKRRLNGGRVRVVHLATHGFFESPARFAALRAGANQLEPAVEALTVGQKAGDTAASDLTPLLRSGVVLAGGGALNPMTGLENAQLVPTEDGILTAEEAQALDLRGTELVVLSACQTALGDLEAGQGVLGLQRAFEAAGARAVVASLWRVDDAATAVLMERFYANLWTKRLPTLEALRQAQLDLLKDPSLVNASRARLAARGISPAPERLPSSENALRTKPSAARRGDPAVWAAFLLSGDGR
jgi:CHAT domain-containing protein/Tfp pilus assembly protein PilF